MKILANRLFVVALSITILALAIEFTPQVKAAGTVFLVGYNGDVNLEQAVQEATVDDRIHVETIWGVGFPYGVPLSSDLVITQSNLWIIGQPPAKLGDPMPTIDLNGHSIIVKAAGVFIWGLNITDSGDPPDEGYAVGLLVGGCKLMNCTITGKANTMVGSDGVFSSALSNTIALNTISMWNRDVQLNSTLLNNVLGNTLDSYNCGVDVNGTSGLNKIYWNRLMSTDPTAFAFLDESSFPNSFNTTTEGNYEAYWQSQDGGTPFPVTGPNGLVPGPNGDNDYFPLKAPWSRKLGDFNLDGVVNLQDLVILSQGYGVTMNQTQYVPGSYGPPYKYDPRVDIANPIGTTGLSDLVLFALNFTNRI